MFVRLFILIDGMKDRQIQVVSGTRIDSFARFINSFDPRFRMLVEKEIFKVLFILEMRNSHV